MPNSPTCGVFQEKIYSSKGLPRSAANLSEDYPNGSRLSFNSVGKLRQTEAYNPFNDVFVSTDSCLHGQSFSQINMSTLNL